MNIHVDHNEAHLTVNELTSIKALVAWVANQRGLNDEVPLHYVATKFGVTDIANIKRGDYDRVIRCLIDDINEIRVH